MFIRINPDEVNFNIFKAINEMHRHIKKSTKKSLIHKISKRLIELGFKSNHSTIAKALKRVIKKVLPLLESMVQNVKNVRLIVLVVRMLHTILKKENEMMRDKVIRGKLRCFNCNHKKSNFKTTQKS